MQLHVGKTDKNAEYISRSRIIAIPFGMHILHTNALPPTFSEWHELVFELHALVAKPAPQEGLLW